MDIKINLNIMNKLTNFVTFAYELGFPVKNDLTKFLTETLKKNPEVINKLDYSDAEKKQLINFFKTAKPKDFKTVIDKLVDDNIIALSIWKTELPKKINSLTILDKEYQVFYDRNGNSIYIQYLDYQIYFTPFFEDSENYFIEVVDEDGNTDTAEFGPYPDGLIGDLFSTINYCQDMIVKYIIDNGLFASEDLDDLDDLEDIDFENAALSDLTELMNSNLNDKIISVNDSTEVSVELNDGTNNLIAVLDSNGLNYINFGEGKLELDKNSRKGISIKAWRNFGNKLFKYLSYYHVEIYNKLMNIFDIFSLTELTIHEQPYVFENNEIEIEGIKIYITKEEEGSLNISTDDYGDDYVEAESYDIDEIDTKEELESIVQNYYDKILSETIHNSREDYEMNSDIWNLDFMEDDTIEVFGEELAFEFDNIVYEDLGISCFCNDPKVLTITVSNGEFQKGYTYKKKIGTDKYQVEKHIETSIEKYRNL